MAATGSDGAMTARAVVAIATGMMARARWRLGSNGAPFFQRVAQGRTAVVGPLRGRVRLGGMSIGHPVIGWIGEGRRVAPGCHGREDEDRAKERGLFGFGSCLRADGRAGL